MKKKKAASSSKSGLILPGPDELNIPSDNLGDYAICLYGKKSIGKTSLAAKFPGAIVGQLEAFRQNLKIRQYTLNEGWEQTLEFFDACVNDDTVQTVVVDTIDVLYDQCLTYECHNRGIKDPNDIQDYGATWRAIKDGFNKALNTVRTAGKALLVLSHQQTRKVEVRYGEAYDEIEPSCQKGPRQWIEEVCDLVLYYHYHEKKRAISVRPLESANMEAWCACGPEDHFLDPSGEPLCMFEVPSTNAKDAYRVLDDAFRNKVWDCIRGKPSKKKKDSDE